MTGAAPPSSPSGKTPPAEEPPPSPPVSRPGPRGAAVLSPGFALDIILYVFTLTRLLYQALVSLFWERRKSKKLVFKILLQQVYFTAVQSLPLTLLVAVAIGALLMNQASTVLPTYGFPDYAEWITVRLLLREIAPVVVALVIIARSANAIVIEIGNMQVNGELRALDVLGFNIDYFIVLPRVAGMLLSTITLTICFCAAALWGGFWLTESLGLLESSFVLENLERNFTLPILANILARSAGFGLVISLVACCHGLRVRVSPTEVPQQASRGVVRSLALCFVLNFVVSVWF